MYSYRLADRLHMIQSEMIERMPLREFYERMLLDTMANDSPAEKPAQTAEEMLSLFPVG